MVATTIKSHFYMVFSRILHIHYSGKPPDYSVDFSYQVKLYTSPRTTISARMILLSTPVPFLVLFLPAISSSMLAFEAMDLLRGRGPLTDAEVNNITKTVVIGVTYPNLTVVPTNLQFSCSQVHQPGYYVNMEPQAGCQVYHRCELDLPLYTFLCPVGKLFNQITLNCDWWFNVQCQKSGQFYDYSNPRLYLGPNVTFLDGGGVSQQVISTAPPGFVASADSNSWPNTISPVVTPWSATSVIPPTASTTTDIGHPKPHGTLRFPVGKRRSHHLIRPIVSSQNNILTKNGIPAKPWTNFLPASTSQSFTTLNGQASNFISSASDNVVAWSTKFDGKAPNDVLIPNAWEGHLPPGPTEQANWNPPQAVWSSVPLESNPPVGSWKTFDTNAGPEFPTPSTTATPWNSFEIPTSGWNVNAPTTPFSLQWAKEKFEGLVPNNQLQSSGGFVRNGEMTEWSKPPPQFDNTVAQAQDSGLWSFGNVPPDTTKVNFIQTAPNLQNSDFGDLRDVRISSVTEATAMPTEKPVHLLPNLPFASSNPDPNSPEALAGVMFPTKNGRRRRGNRRKSLNLRSSTSRLFENGPLQVNESGGSGALRSIRVPQVQQLVFAHSG